MSKLREVVMSSSETLKIASKTLNEPSTKSNIPQKSFNLWESNASLHYSLERTAPIIDAREKAWSSLANFAKQIESPEFVQSYHSNEGLDLTNESINQRTNPFDIDRHLMLLTYVTVTWSVYDRIANACGRLMGIEEISKGESKNPKLLEDIIGYPDPDRTSETGNKKDKNKSRIGFCTQTHLQELYAWPALVSYKIRNWLVHEGCEQGTTKLFNGEATQDGFILSLRAIQIIEEACQVQSTKEHSVFSRNDPAADPWNNKDLLNILKCYNNAIDILLIAILKWSTDSFYGQVNAFIPRDL